MRRPLVDRTAMVSSADFASRSNWQIVLERRMEKGKLKYQDWDELVNGFQEPSKGSKSLLQRHLDQEEHIKPTEIKRRINQKKKYVRSVKQLEDLTSYIKFVQDSEANEK